MHSFFVYPKKGQELLHIYCFWRCIGAFGTTLLSIKLSSRSKSPSFLNTTWPVKLCKQNASPLRSMSVEESMIKHRTMLMKEFMKQRIQNEIIVSLTDLDIRRSCFRSWKFLKCPAHHQTSPLSPFEKARRQPISCVLFQRPQKRSTVGIFKAFCQLYQLGRRRCRFLITPEGGSGGLCDWGLSLGFRIWVWVWIWD